MLSKIYGVSVDDLLKEEVVIQPLETETDTTFIKKEKRGKNPKKTQASDKDEGFILLVIAAVSALIFPLGFIIIPFIMRQNKKANTLYKLVCVVCVLVVA